MDMQVDTQCSILVQRQVVAVWPAVHDWESEYGVAVTSGEAVREELMVCSST